MAAKHIEGLYEITRDYEKENNQEECYHRLAGLCDSIMNIDDFSFDLDKFSINEKKQFIMKFIELLEAENPLVTNIYKAQKEKKMPNKKMIYTLSKEDVDNSLDYVMKIFLEYGYEYEKESYFIPNHSMSRMDLTRIMVEEAQNFRFEIRHTNRKALEKYERCYKAFMDCFNEGIATSLERRNNKWHNLLESLYVNYKAFNTFADIYFQSILYLLIDNGNLTKEEKLSRLTNMSSAIERIGDEFVPKTNQADKYNIFYSFAVYLMYLDYRNTCRNNIVIQDILMAQMNEASYLKDIAEEYQCKGRYIDEISTKNEMRNIILEGKSEKEERFNENMGNIQHLMVLLNTITGRELGADYLQHVKVTYREIIEDNYKYNNKTARTIMRNIERKEIPFFESEKETYFIREKISRGFMREKGYAEEYIIKNKIQSSVFNTILKLYTSYDELRIAKDARQLFAKYSKVMRESLKE